MSTISISSLPRLWALDGSEFFLVERYGGAWRISAEDLARELARLSRNQAIRENAVRPIRPLTDMAPTPIFGRNLDID